MRGFNFNISSFFGGAGSNSGFGSFNFSDYASIKNGSYGKLMRSYYSEQKKASTPDKTTSTKPGKKETVDNTGLSQMKKETDGLKTAAEALSKDELWKKNDDGTYDMDKIASAVKDFAKEYNDVVDQSAKVNSREISQSAYYMKSMTNTMSKALAKVGVTIGTDGKMTVNEDTLKKANVASIKSLFSGYGSYGAQTGDRAGEMSREAVMSSSVYGKNGSLSSSLSNMFNKWI